MKRYPQIPARGNTKSQYAVEEFSKNVRCIHRDNCKVGYHIPCCSCERFEEKKEGER